ncbi:type II secretion system major pseudopilin GspG [Spongiibacter nanhainus]|uniref:Type II secretion system major pseudopilin GspG n=1 Tax=Spongiibacter nanhainus TaxID=2794344 RepID=A0A7T4R3Q0_9GAMM|nr:type II secretion system major pseudopilin GspG [Spongiibacter nanhainus]QQD19929.1 type II secretion system major pseudopilin GspG [Spongiibacter nanhainus]
MRLATRTPKLAKRREAGISLREVMLVLAVVAVLALIFAYILMQRLDGAVGKQVDSELNRLSAALHRYKLDNRRYPTSEQGLEALLAVPIVEPIPNKWQGPYVDRPSLTEDPWGRPYRYQSSHAPPRFEIVTLGADNTAGGKGVNADISLVYQSDTLLD